MTLLEQEEWPPLSTSLQAHIYLTLLQEVQGYEFTAVALQALANKYIHGMKETVSVSVSTHSFSYVFLSFLIC